MLKKISVSVLNEINQMKLDLSEKKSFGSYNVFFEIFSDVITKCHYFLNNKS